MRWSLQGAMVGWLVLAAVWLVAPSLGWVVFPWPASFTALWIMHLFVFGMRGVQRLSAMDATRDQGFSTTSYSRRNVLQFARYAAAAVVASVVIPSRVRAEDDGCPDGMHICSDDIHCCPDGASYDCLVDNCDPDKSRTCYPYTDENAKYLLQCCGELVNC
jgi:hypothetical protein